MSGKKDPGGLRISKKISVVIPAYNEEKRIGKTLDRILEYCAENFSDFEIIVVDDCSKDGTIEVVKSKKSEKILLVKNRINRGKGGAVKRGMLKARFGLVLFSDSDLATPIEEIKNMIKFSEKGFDVVIASRRLKGSKITVNQPKYRQLLGQAFPFLVNAIAGLKIKDTQCGFKLFTKKAARKCFGNLTVKRFAFDVEVLYLAKKYGYRIKEVPVVWVDKPGTKVSVVKDSLMMLKDILKIRVNDWVLDRYRRGN